MTASPFDPAALAAPGIAGLTPYQPGKPEGELAREYGVADIVKLASNENPLGPSPQAVAAAGEVLAGMHRYPDGGAWTLRQRLAARHDVAPECLVLGNGSNDVLDLVARAFLAPGRAAVFAEHAFAVYPIATRSAGAEAVVVPANPADHAQPYGHDLAAMATAAARPGVAVVFVANPNNPTGTWAGADAVAAFLEAVPREVIVVLDEAYVEYAADATGYAEGRPWLERYPNLVLTRSFSKVYGLAGLRVGYGLAHPAVADLMNRVRQPFNVNAAAQAAALAALDDGDHIARSVAENAAERGRLTTGLERLGLRVLPSAGNFVCTRVGDAAAVNEALLRAGVIVRPVAGYGLPEWLRITVGRPPENDRLLAALARCREQGLLAEA